MKIMTILGSPKMAGNTAGALAMLERELGDGHEIDRVNLPELDVMGCQGCYACQQKPNEASCVVRDGATDVLKRIAEADAVVYAAPLYMWGLPAKIHALLERHLSLVTGYMVPELQVAARGEAHRLPCDVRRSRGEQHGVPPGCHRQNVRVLEGEAGREVHRRGNHHAGRGRGQGGRRSKEARRGPRGVDCGQQPRELHARKHLRESYKHPPRRRGQAAAEGVSF